MSGREEFKQRGRRQRKRFRNPGYHRQQNQQQGPREEQELRQQQQHQQQINPQPPPKSQINYFLNIPETYMSTPNQPKWTTIHCTPNIKILYENVSRAWTELDSEVFRYIQTIKHTDDSDSDDDEPNRNIMENFKIVVYSWAFVYAAQSILWSCANPGETHIQLTSLCGQLDSELSFKHYLDYFHLNVIRSIAFQYGKVDCFQNGQTIVPFDPLGDIRALIRIARELLANFPKDNSRKKSMFTDSQVEQVIKRSWLPSYQNDGRFYMILSVGISKFMSLKADWHIRPSELANCMRRKIVPEWWKHFKAQLPEQSQNKLDFIFTDWTLENFMQNLSNENQLLKEFKLEWSEPDIKHLAFDFNLNEGLKSLFDATRSLNSFLKRENSSKQFLLDKYSHTGSFGQVGHMNTTLDFYHKFKSDEKQKITLAHAFPPLVICDIECKYNSEEILSNFETLPQMFNSGYSVDLPFSKPIYFTPCMSTLYENLDSAWKVSWPRYLSHFSQLNYLNFDTNGREKLRRLMQAVGFLCCTESIRKSINICAGHVKLFSYLMNDEFLKNYHIVFQSIFEVAAQYGSVGCDETGMKLVPVSVKYEIAALTRIVQQIMPKHLLSQNNSEAVSLITEEEVKQILDRSWLPTTCQDYRFYFIISRKIAKKISTDFPISPMNFVKFMKNNQIHKHQPRPKWWKIFREKLPENSRDRLEFIFSKNWTEQHVLDNLGDSVGKQLLNLLELEWNCPQKEHLMFGMNNAWHTDKYKELFDIYFGHMLDTLQSNRSFYQNDQNLIKLKEAPFVGSWGQLSDAVNDDPKRRVFHRRIENDTKRAIAQKYPPVVLYEYVTDTEFIN